MKKSIFIYIDKLHAASRNGTVIAATLLLGSFAQTTHAQSSVTLYGTVDEGIVFASGEQTTSTSGATSGHAAYAVGGGNLVPARWGIMGTEDLGAGLKAKFALENSIYAGSGTLIQSNALFNRQAWVGLGDDRYGTLTFGRQYDPYSDFLGAYVSSNSWATLYGSHFGDIDNLNEAFNFNNSVKYISPVWKGWSIGSLFSFGNTAGNFSTNKGWSVAINYTNQGFSAAAGYLELNNPFNAALGGEDGYFGDASCANTAAEYCQLQNTAKERLAGIGASYTFGKATTALTYTHNRFFSDQYFATTARPGGRDLTFDILEWNNTYMVNAALQLGIAYIANRAKVSDAGTTWIHQINLGTNYSFSGRTALYAVAIGQISSGAGLGIDSTGNTENLAEIPNLVNANSNRQLAIIAGIRHNF